VCPLGTRVIRRARVLRDAEGDCRSSLPLDVTKVFDHTTEPPLMYGWIGQQSGSDFSDLAPSILHYNWF
jgi:hypothetical protein